MKGELTLQVTRPQMDQYQQAFHSRQLMTVAVNGVDFAKAVVYRARVVRLDYGVDYEEPEVTLAIVEEVR